MSARFSIVIVIALAATLALLGACTSEPESTEARVVLVTGATGNQGGAVARELLSRGYAVRGLTRNPGSDRARALTELGIEMVRGDFDDAASLDAAMQGAYGVFAVTNFWEHGYDREVAHGKSLVDAAAAADVQHFVFTSVASADENTGLPHFDSKFEVEKHLAASGLTFTVLRPAEFLDNLRFMREEIMSGKYIDPRSPDRSHQWIAVSDIGFFVGEALDNPTDWAGRTEELAGVEMTVGEFVACLEEITGIRIEYVQPSWEEFENLLGEEMTDMNRWFDNTGYSIDVKALRDQYPTMKTLPQYLRETGWQPQ